MISSSKGNLSVHFAQNNKVGNVALMVGWKIPDINYFVYLKLARGDPCACSNLAHGSEITTLCFSLYQHIRSKLLSDPKVQNATKVSKVWCGVQNGEFSICVTPAANFSSIRKVLSVIMNNLEPEKLSTCYASCIKMLNAKPVKSEFEHCVSLLHNAFKSTTCLIVGKTSLDKNKVDVLANLSEKYTAHSGPKGTVPESLKTNINESEYPAVQASSGSDAVIVYEYMSKYLDEHMSIHDSKVLVHKANWSLPTKMSDKDRIKNWAKRFEKVENLSSAIVFIALCNCLINVSDAVSLIKDDIKANDLVNILTKSIK